MSVNHSVRSGSIIGIYITDFLYYEGMFVFSLASPHRGDSNECTQYTIFNIKKEITLNFPKYAAMDFFQGIQVRVRTEPGRGHKDKYNDLLPTKCISFPRNMHFVPMIYYYFPSK